jgi:hypothetical protein
MLLLAGWGFLGSIPTRFRHSHLGTRGGVYLLESEGYRNGAPGRARGSLFTDYAFKAYCSAKPSLASRCPHRVIYASRPLAVTVSESGPLAGR